MFKRSSLLTLCAIYLLFVAAPNLHAVQQATAQAQVNETTAQETAPTPEQPTLGDSWKKLVLLRWGSLSRDDLENIALSVFCVAGIYSVYYLHTHDFGTQHNTTPPMPPHVPNNPMSPAHAHAPTGSISTTPR